jgi:hypothetical protein
MQERAARSLDEQSKIQGFDGAGISLVEYLYELAKKKELQAMGHEHIAE